MTNNQIDNKKEIQKKKYFGIVIDKITVIEMLVGTIAIFGGMLFIFYLAGIF
ncbi:MAG TPA: hypothetical protein PKN50_11720 [Spirochaetota bacterium]|nr:hypothetical protein [Spirochaetota bacterium]HPV40339.1 hypothetical protein [Spirochaetota bacterium]